MEARRSGWTAAFLTATAVVEVGAGLALLLVPRATLGLLLGVEQAATETLLVSRVTGAALLAIGSASWLGRHDAGSPARLGLLGGILIYDLAAAALLAYAGTALGLGGVILWPVVALHGTFSVWGVACLPRRPVGA